MEIIENNILIAKFLGYQYYPYPDTKGTAGYKLQDVHVHPKLMWHGKVGERTYLCRLHKELDFHRDWNWLMPVVVKIREFKNDMQFGPDRNDINLIIVSQLTPHLLRGDIQLVWDDCVQIIKEINENANSRDANTGELSK